MTRVTFSDQIRALTGGAISRVDENVLISGYLAAADAENVARHRVTHILKLFSDDTSYPGGYHRHPGVKYLVVDAKDVPGFRLDNHFYECLQFVQDAIRTDGVVLVHCHAGVSRSATIVLLHRMINHGERLKDAMTHLRERRPFVNPNEGFWTMLRGYDERTSRFRAEGRAPPRPTFGAQGDPDEQGGHPAEAGPP